MPSYVHLCWILIGLCLLPVEKGHADLFVVYLFGVRLAVLWQGAQQFFPQSLAYLRQGHLLFHSRWSCLLTKGERQEYEQTSYVKELGTAKKLMKSWMLKCGHPNSCTSNPVGSFSQVLASFCRILLTNSWLIFTCRSLVYHHSLI